MELSHKLITFLKKNLFITLQEGRTLGMNEMTFSRFVTEGKLYRVERGIYARNIDWLTDPLKKYCIACTRFKGAVICGISALSYYELTDEEEKNIWVALPQLRTLKNPRYRFIRPQGISYKLGIEKYIFGRRNVRIYDREKTIVDAFKYLNEEVALKALKGYLKNSDKNISQLCNYARKLKKPLDDIITVLLADE